MNEQELASACAVRLTIRYPFWTEIFYSMTVKKATDEMVAGGMKTQATDGRNVWLAEPRWSKLALVDQVTEMVHELIHKILLHNTRRGARDAYMWNVACDYAVNSLMVMNGFVLNTNPYDPVHNPEGGWLLDRQYDNWLVEHIYADIMSKAKGGKKYMLVPGRGDVLAPEGLTPEQVEQMEAEVQLMVDRAIANGKAYGNLPIGIEQGVVEAFAPRREAWYNTLHRFMQSLATSEYNWAKPNRRTLKTFGVLTPLHQSEALGTVRIFIDASGSVFDAESQANFAGHLNAILSEAKPRAIWLYYFDAKVYPGERFDAGTLEIESKPRGGGGTDFRPLFEQDNLDPEDSEDPAVCIVLTDMEGPFGDDPGYPVFWASIEDHPAPWGEVVLLEDTK